MYVPCNSITTDHYHRQIDFLVGVFSVRSFTVITRQSRLTRSVSLHSCAGSSVQGYREEKNAPPSYSEAKQCGELAEMIAVVTPDGYVDVGMTMLTQKLDQALSIRSCIDQLVESNCLIRSISSSMKNGLVM